MLLILQPGTTEQAAREIASRLRMFGPVMSTFLKSAGTLICNSFTGALAMS